MSNSARATLISTLREAGQASDSAFPLGEVALALGALARAHADIDAYRQHLQGVQDRVAENFRRQKAALSGTNPVVAKARVLSSVICDEFGYVGDRLSYDDLRNANLLDVIDRRRGLPVALGILYLHVAQSLGWDAGGLSFPGHFVLSLEKEGESVILDPFDGGRMVGNEDLRDMLVRMAGPTARLSADTVERVSNRNVVLRLQNNIKMRLLGQNAFDQAAEILDCMTMIAPDRSDLFYELSGVFTRAGKLGAAIKALGGCLAAEPPDDLKRDAELTLQSLKRRLN